MRLQATEQVLEKAVFSRVAFEDATVHQVVRFFTDKLSPSASSEVSIVFRSASSEVTVEHDTPRGGAQIAPERAMEIEPVRVTLDLTNVTARRAIDVFCRQAGIWWYLDPDLQFTARRDLPGGPGTVHAPAPQIR